MKIFNWIKALFLLLAAFFGFKIAGDIQTNKELRSVKKARKIEKTNRGLKRDDLINGL